MTIKRIEHNTIEIAVPNKMLYISGGKSLTKPTLTTTRQISTVEGKKTIKLVPSKENYIKILNEGRIVDLKEERQKAKDRKKRAKDITDIDLDKIIFIDKIKNIKLKRIKNN